MALNVRPSPLPHPASFQHIPNRLFIHIHQQLRRLAVPGTPAASYLHRYSPFRNPALCSNLRNQQTSRMSTRPSKNADAPPPLTAGSKVGGEGSVLYCWTCGRVICGCFLLLDCYIRMLLLFTYACGTGGEIVTVVLMRTLLYSGPCIVL